MLKIEKVLKIEKIIRNLQNINLVTSFLMKQYYETSWNSSIQ